MLGLEISRQIQDVNLIWLPLVLTEASSSLFDRFLPGIHIEKQLRWAHKLGGAEPLGISKVGQTVLARLMESQVWHQLTGSVGVGFSKGTMASAHPDARHFSSSLYATHAFQAATLVLELRESESE